MGWGTNPPKTGELTTKENVENYVGNLKVTPQLYDSSALGYFIAVTQDTILPAGGRFLVFGIDRQFLSAGGHSSTSIEGTFVNIVNGGTALNQFSTTNSGFVGFAWRIE